MEQLSSKEDETDCLTEFFNLLLGWSFIQENQIKVSILGKWYDLPMRVVEPIKKLIADTKDYDKYFLNLCINYDGREEIVDACKLIAKQVKLDKVAAENIDKALIKENIYASYFLPPDLMIKTGKKKTLNGFLLWDSTNAKVYFSEVLWPEFGKEDFIKSVVFYQSH
jgi:undecaprenyl diphosphate synthase